MTCLIWYNLVLLYDLFDVMLCYVHACSLCFVIQSEVTDSNIELVDVTVFVIWNWFVLESLFVVVNCKLSFAIFSKTIQLPLRWMDGWLAIL